MKALSTYVRAAIAGALVLASMNLSAARADQWITPAESSHFQTTPDPETALAYLQRLAQAAPGRIKLETLGISPQGRPIVAAIANADGAFSPAVARARHLPVIFIQGGIHPGEIEGADAGLMLLRDYAVSGKLPHLADHLVLIYLPVFSVDGLANSSPWHRINQDGPQSQGFRGQSQYLNLNRDYIKADAPEMRAWLRFWNRWLPDDFVDIHTTDGADYPYDLTWYTEDSHRLDPAVDQWQNQLMQKLIPAYQAHGHLASIYLEFKDGRDPSKGIENFGSGPRFSTGYAALQNRPGLLIETHMLKPYAVRVRAVYDLVSEMLGLINRDPQSLLQATTKADADTVARAAEPGAVVPLTFKLDPVPTTYDFQAYGWTLTHSDISGAAWIHYDRSVRKTLPIPNWNRLLPDRSIVAPAGYVIPAQWTDLIAHLQAHGIQFRRLAQAVTVSGQGYQLDDPQWASQPFEGHLMLTHYTLSEQPRSVRLPPGSVVVPMNQRAANLAIALLEPQAPDSLLQWGYLNAIFEPKEYGEPRVLESLARRMLAKNPALRTAFDRKLASDPAFAASPSARLRYFFERSPWYSAQDVGAYPVLRLDAEALARLPNPTAPTP
ncbi:M14 family metallopeptidase [Frateuria aurantia]